MVASGTGGTEAPAPLSVLALSSRFDGQHVGGWSDRSKELSVLALSSRFDGPTGGVLLVGCYWSFSTRSVESF